MNDTCDHEKYRKLFTIPDYSSSSEIELKKIANLDSRYFRSGYYIILNDSETTMSCYAMFMCNGCEKVGLCDVKNSVKIEIGHIKELIKNVMMRLCCSTTHLKSYLQFLLILLMAYRSHWNGTDRSDTLEFLFKNNDAKMREIFSKAEKADCDKAFEDYYLTICGLILYKNYSDKDTKWQEYLEYLKLVFNYKSYSMKSLCKTKNIIYDTKEAPRKYSLKVESTTVNDEYTLESTWRSIFVLLVQLSSLNQMELYKTESTGKLENKILLIALYWYLIAYLVYISRVFRYKVDIWYEVRKSSLKETALINLETELNSLFKEIDYTNGISNLTEFWNKIKVIHDEHYNAVKNNEDEDSDADEDLDDLFNVSGSIEISTVNQYMPTDDITSEEITHELNSLTAESITGQFNQAFKAQQEKANENEKIFKIAIEEISKNMDKVNEEIKKNQQELLEVQKEMEKYKELAKSQSVELQEIQSQRVRIMKMRKAVEKLEKDLDKKKKKIQESQQELVKKDNELNEITDQARKLKEDYDVLCQTILNIQDQAIKTKESIKVMELEERIEELNKRQMYVKTDVEKARSKLEEMKKSTGEMGEKIKKDKEEIDEKNKQYQDEYKSLTQEHRKCDEALTKFAELLKQKTKMIELAKDKKRELEQLKYDQGKIKENQEKDLAGLKDQLENKLKKRAEEFNKCACNGYLVKYTADFMKTLLKENGVFKTRLVALPFKNQKFKIYKLVVKQGLCIIKCKELNAKYKYQELTSNEVENLFKEWYNILLCDTFLQQEETISLIQLAAHFAACLWFNKKSIPLNCDGDIKREWVRQCYSDASKKDSEPFDKLEYLLSDASRKLQIHLHCDKSLPENKNCKVSNVESICLNNTEVGTVLFMLELNDKSVQLCENTNSKYTKLVLFFDPKARQWLSIGNLMDELDKICQLLTKGPKPMDVYPLMRQAILLCAVLEMWTKSSDRNFTKKKEALKGTIKDLLNENISENIFKQIETDPLKYCEKFSQFKHTQQMILYFKELEGKLLCGIQNCKPLQENKPLQEDKKIKETNILRKEMTSIKLKSFPSFEPTECNEGVKDRIMEMFGDLKNTTHIVEMIIRLEELLFLIHTVKDTSEIKEIHNHIETSTERYILEQVVGSLYDQCDRYFAPLLSAFRSVVLLKTDSFDKTYNAWNTYLESIFIHNEKGCHSVKEDLFKTNDSSKVNFTSYGEYTIKRGNTQYGYKFEKGEIKCMVPGADFNMSFELQDSAIQLCRAFADGLEDFKRSLLQFCYLFYISHHHKSGHRQTARALLKGIYDKINNLKQEKCSIGLEMRLDMLKYGITCALNYRSHASFNDKLLHLFTDLLGEIRFDYNLPCSKLDGILKSLQQTSTFCYFHSEKEICIVSLLDDMRHMILLLEGNNSSLYSQAFGKDKKIWHSKDFIKEDENMNFIESIMGYDMRNVIELIVGLKIHSKYQNIEGINTSVERTISKLTQAGKFTDYADYLQQLDKEDGKRNSLTELFGEYFKKLNDQCDPEDLIEINIGKKSYRVQVTTIFRDKDGNESIIRDRVYYFEDENAAVECLYAE